MRAIDFIASFQPFSKERIGIASRGEIKRWFAQGAIQVNGEITTDWNEDTDTWTNGVFSLVLFPKGKRVTLW